MARTPVVPTESGTRGMRETLVSALRRAAEAVVPTDTPLPAVEVTTPPSHELGDFATNLALQLAPHLRRAPLEVAEALIARLERVPFLQEATVAPPGFINFALSPAWLHETVGNILHLGTGYGRSDLGHGLRVLIEFVSANPTGPLTVANGRGGAVGDVLGNLLEFTGYAVEREYYINDALTSTQVQKFGGSLAARYLQLLGHEAHIPEGGYQGDYLMDLARELVAAHGDRYVAMDPATQSAQLGRWGTERLLESIKSTLERFGIHYDTFASERAYHERGAVERATADLKAAGHSYEHEGATWLRSTQWGDDKDRILVRHTGAPTYLASDVAYHRDKFERGFDRLINIWGADHHGYVMRTKAAVAALGYDPDALHIIIHQLVNLYRGQEPVRMSTRAGEFVTLDEVLEEVGPDATRFFMLSRAADTPVNFDLKLAKEHSLENPVYYVQYAHTRCCSIFREAAQRGVTIPDPEHVDLSGLTGPEEVCLQRHLADFPEIVEVAARSYEPHNLTRGAHDLANAFHVFYTECRVLGAEERLQAARFALVAATQIVLAQVLRLLGISAPDRM